MHFGDVCVFTGAPLFAIDPFSVSEHCDVYLWAELRWRQKDSPDRFTKASYEVC